MNHKTILAATAVLLTIPAARADIPGILSYQGRITVGGTNFNGTGQFKFALVNSGATQTYWSNGVNAVSLTVNKGLYSVLLGDTTLANMATAIQPAVFTNGDVRLRVWFNDGVSGLQQLSPDQRLAAAGYALMANVADGSITSNKLAAGAVTTASIASNAVTAAQLASGAVTSASLAAGAVGSAQLASNLTVSGSLAASTFTGNGAGLTSVNADLLDGQHGAFYQNAVNLNAGTLSDARLSANVALLSANQTYSGTNRFASVVTATNVANTFAGTFSGNGGGLTNLSAASLAGTIPLAQLPSSLVTNGASGVTFTGTFSGSGAGMTNVNLVTANTQGAITWATNWTGKFILGSSPSTGPYPGSVVAADVNGDGSVDLVSGNDTSSTLSVLLNNGYGLFSLASSPAAGAGLYCVTTTDVNSDGKPDLVTANSSANTASVLINAGGNNFVLSSSPGVGNTPYGIAAADVNSDGKPDLITANFGANTLSVLTNGPGNSFTLASSPAVGTQPCWVLTADVNSDGRTDLVSVNQGANTLSVLTNNGTGSFTLSANLAVGTLPKCAVAADVNGDGKVDLVSANRTAGTLSVLTNNGTGGFTLSATVSVGTSPQAVTAADVNKDGKMDLVTANRGANTSTILLNNGAGGFVLADTVAVGNIPEAVTTADVNNDGGPDVIVANAAANTLSVLVNTPDYSAIFTGSGAGLTGLDAGELTGTVPDARLSANAVFLNASQVFVSSNRFAGVVNITNAANSLAGSFTGNGGGLTNLNASALASGTVPDVRLSANVALLNGNQVFTGANRFAGAVTMTNAANLIAGNGAGLANVVPADGSVTAVKLAAGAVTSASIANNAVTATQLAGGAVTSNALANGSVTSNALAAGAVGSAQLASSLTISGSMTVGSFIGNGAGLTSVNADQLDGQQGAYYQNAGNLNAGSLPDARLSANVAQLNATQVFTGANRFSGAVTITNAANVLGGTVSGTFSGTATGSFSGNGGGLTNLTSSGDYVFAYSTVTHTLASSGVFVDIANSVNAQIEGWSHTAGTASFTCGQTGLYWIQYKGQVSFREANADETVSLRAIVGSTEIAGSDSAVYGNKNATAVADDLVVPVSASFIAAINLGDVLKFQIAGTAGTALTPNTGYSTTKPSFSCTIIRIK